MLKSRLKQARKELRKYSSKRKAVILSGFFKTGKGEYGEGDIFIGVVVPDTRKVAARFQDLAPKDAERLLRSRIHEERLLSLIILVNKYPKAGPEEKQKIFRLYLKNTRYINNWDLVDLSAPQIVGSFLLDKDRKLLYKLARSKLLWEKRIAILATLRFIRERDFSDTLKIAGILLCDHHDLIHKAAGWMLRELGKRDQAKEEAFLKRHSSAMPRTMLRYAIERFPPAKKKGYMARSAD